MVQDQVNKEVVSLQWCSSRPGTNGCTGCCDQVHCHGEAATICPATTLISSRAPNEENATGSLCRIADWSRVYLKGKPYSLLLWTEINRLQYQSRYFSDGFHTISYNCLLFTRSVWKVTGPMSQPIHSNSKQQTTWFTLQSNPPSSTAMFHPSLYCCKDSSWMTHSSIVMALLTASMPSKCLDDPLEIWGKEKKSQMEQDHVNR